LESIQHGRKAQIEYVFENKHRNAHGKNDMKRLDCAASNGSIGINFGDLRPSFPTALVRLQVSTRGRCPEDRVLTRATDPSASHATSQVQRAAYLAGRRLILCASVAC
jgi:hypothetical protein